MRSTNFSHTQTNIEYAAAILEQGALRAFSLGLEPSAFNSVTWYMKGIQTDQEIKESGWDTGAAIYALWDIPKVLSTWGLSASWNLAGEPQYARWVVHAARVLGWEWRQWPE